MASNVSVVPIMLDNDVEQYVDHAPSPTTGIASSVQPELRSACVRNAASSNKNAVRHVVRHAAHVHTKHSVNMHIRICSSNE